MKRFIISDTHFGHANIITYEGRPFENADEMDSVLIKNWNSVVSKDDIVWHLGDFSLKSNQDDIKSIVSKLHGRKQIILGNHDNAEGDFVKRWTNMGFEFVSKYPVIIDSYFILSHEPVFLCSNEPLNIAGRSLGNSNFTHCHNIHGHLHKLKYSDEKHYTNVSVENTNYMPLDLDILIQSIIEKHNSE